MLSLAGVFFLKKIAIRISITMYTIVYSNQKKSENPNPAIEGEKKMRKEEIFEMIVLGSVKYAARLYFEAYLKDILEAIRKIENYTKDISFDDFVNEILSEIEGASK